MRPNSHGKLLRWQTSTGTRAKSWETAGEALYYTTGSGLLKQPDKQKLARFLYPRDLDAILDGSERVLDKRIRADAVGRRPQRRDQLEAGGVLDRPSEGHGRRSARDGERLNQVSGHRLPTTLVTESSVPLKGKTSSQLSP
jgi:hypothetical protein